MGAGTIDPAPFLCPISAWVYPYAIQYIRAIQVYRMICLGSTDQCGLLIEQASFRIMGQIW